MGNEFFSILVDECRDVSVKEQMGIVVQYVDKNGCVIECFLVLCMLVIQLKQRENIIKEIASDEIITREYDQEMSLKQPGDTRCCSHYGALVNLIHYIRLLLMFLSMLGRMAMRIHKGKKLMC